MNTEEAIKRLKGHIEGIPAVRDAGRHSGVHLRWLQNAKFELGRMFGRRSTIVGNFNQLPWGIPPGQQHEISRLQDVRKQIDALHEAAFQKDLERAEGFLQSAIDQLEQVGLDQLRRDSGYVVADGAAKIFISHGHAEDVLRRVEDYIRALGSEPVVVKRGPSQGESLDDLVEKRIEECQAQIILATADDEIEGSWQPRPNVIHEIGLGQRIFKDRIVYLKEDRCEFPSNIAPKVWESFGRENLEPAFERIAKELRAMGLL